MPVDYSRFDDIDTSDSEDERRADGQAAMAAFAAAAAGAATEVAVAQRPAPPSNVLDDLEDYFERLDARRATNEGQGPENMANAASVERFSEREFEQLSRVQGPGARADGLECAICLAGVCAEEACVELPCAARHRFHVDCARSWLTRDVSCPLCRVDVRHLVRTGVLAVGALPIPQARSADSEVGNTSPRSFGFTRDGGIIARYEPRPPPELERPAYIPQHLREVAELVEIDYPDRGTARVWRVPRS